jgi:hypothetical protein
MFYGASGASGVGGVASAVVVGLAVQCLLGGHYRAPLTLAIANRHRSSRRQDLGHDVAGKDHGIVSRVEVDRPYVRIGTFASERSPQSGNPRTRVPARLGFGPARSVGTSRTSFGDVRS